MVKKTDVASEKLVGFALEHSPSLIFDCANVADPHVYFPYFREEAFFETYVLPIDLLYKFRDSLVASESFLAEEDITVVVVTSYQGLFHYDNDVENRLVLEHCFDIMESLSQYAPFVVKVD